MLDFFPLPITLNHRIASLHYTPSLFDFIFALLKSESSKTPSYHNLKIIKLFVLFSYLFFIFLYLFIIKKLS
ncbi:hypothetical protein NEOC65_002056 [Neochlamydia sp. AcF65]|nr:hypothetical protein [Neochlamydia sp. AcF65]